MLQIALQETMWHVETVRNGDLTAKMLFFQDPSTNMQVVVPLISEGEFSFGNLSEALSNAEQKKPADLMIAQKKLHIVGGTDG